MAKKKAQKKVNTQSKTNDILIKTFVLTALVSLPLGYVVGATVSDDEYDYTSMVEKVDSHMAANTAHAHDMFTVEAADAPQITSIMVTKDAKSGWNLMVQTENFTFSPTNASGDHVDGEGHAHIYVDGKKITRLYSNHYYLGELDEGEHVVRVTLNTNDHKDYAVNGQVVEATQTITDMHHHDDAETAPHAHN